MENNRHNVMVLIPVYSKKVNGFEKISLQQVVKVLKKYDICLMAPMSLDISEYEQYGIFKVTRFSDGVFIDKNTYSDCLLSVDFYKRFMEYKYVFIYQLDAFVFYDKLEYFCDFNYDYMGAPVPRCAWPNVPTRVGNGGVSLRKIESCIRLLESNALNYVKGKVKISNPPEDLVFSYCTCVKEYDFSGAPYEVAQTFSIDYEVRHIYRNIADNLPFANHAWFKTDYNFWKPIIEKYGYIVPDIPEKKKIPMKWYLIAGALINRLERERYRLPFVYVLSIKRVVGFNECAVWGWGVLGKKIVNIMETINIKVISVFDKDTDYSSRIITYPNRKELEEHRGRLLIVTSRCEDEIMNELLLMGWKLNVDFFLWSDIILKVSKSYIRCLMKSK